MLYGCGSRLPWTTHAIDIYAKREHSTVVLDSRRVASEDKSSLALIRCRRRRIASRSRRRNFDDD